VVISFSLLFHISHGALYGYYVSGNKGVITMIDPQTGNNKALPCDLSKLPQPLSGASMSSDKATNQLQFYFIDAKGEISIIHVNPSTCQSDVKQIKGLNSGQNDVRDMKYGGVAGSLYMVFPDPNCMHGSLDIINSPTATVGKTITTVVDPVGFSQTTGISNKLKKYYFIGLPFPPVSLTYLLNIADLSTGASSNVTLVNNNLGLGDMWDTNFTLNAYDTAPGGSPILIGGVTPPAAAEGAKATGCSPSGFYTVDTVTGAVQCVYGPINMNVYPMADIDASQMMYYQIFTDSSNKFYLATYDIINQKVVSQVPCDICSQLATLNVL